ncbi:hypothetical protein SI65_02257 [Aspergillus cristatus]|uniref:Retrotransposon gag domain-containing protein n=1 Tax=Aspergillus cristatus TaxID=573508 RepID=A0A1E3BKD5_ASPCR|nr:hypothetical protein SI65_02257 [Aspergillus cristatus]
MSNNNNNNATPRSSQGSEGQMLTCEELFGMVSQLQESIITLEEQQSAKAIKVQPLEPFDAFDWFEPTLRDFQEKDKQYQNNNTTEVFSSFTKFKKQLQGTFGDIDATQNTEWKLWRLKQTGSVAKLVSDYQQIITHLNWDEPMYILKFKEMLKPEIQEKLVWME